MKLPIITTLVIALGFLAASITDANKVYKWKDAEGVMHYSSTPPKPTERVSDLKNNLRVTNNKEDTHKPQKETKPRIEKNTKRVSNKAKRLQRQYCNNQRKNLRLLKRKLNVKWIKNGKSNKLNDKQRKDKIRSLENSINADCLYKKRKEINLGIKE
jgi:hypothetical protein